MFLAERLELDVENRGNRVIAWIGALLNLVLVTYDTIRLRFHCWRQRKPEWLWPARLSQKI